MRCLRVFLIGILLLGAFSLNSISSATDWDYIGKNVKGTMLFIDKDKCSSLL